MSTSQDDRDFEIGNLPEGLNVTESTGAPSHLHTNSLDLKQDIEQFGLAEKAYRILELGAGTGYVGIALAQQLQKPAQVYITDLEKVVPLIQDNVHIHYYSQQQYNTSSAAEIIVDRLHWGNHQDAQRLLQRAGGHFDLIVVSDCVYFPELFGMLLETLLDVCGSETKIVIGYKTRSLEKEVGFWQDYFGRYFEYEPVRKIEKRVVKEEEGEDNNEIREEIGDCLGAEDQLYVFIAKRRPENEQFAPYIDEYTQVLTELHEAFYKDQPDDVLQYCANFFHKKLEEQRGLHFREQYDLFEIEQHPLVNKQNDSFTKDMDDNSDNDYLSFEEEEEEEGDNDNDEENDYFSAVTPLSTISKYTNRGRRTSVSAESITPSFTATDTMMTKKKWIPKTDSQLHAIQESVRHNFLFKNLDEEHYEDVMNVMVEKQVESGTVVIEQGATGDYFYVVEEGLLECWIDHQQITSYHAGGSFGELALMYNAPRAATIKAITDCVLWALDRVTFRTILMENTCRKRKMYEIFLEEVPLLKSLVSYERHKIADALESVYFNDGENVILEGNSGDQFYIIESGIAIVYKNNENEQKEVEQKEVNQLERGAYFGELALLNDSPRAATVIAKGKLKCATLSKKAFTRLLGSVHEILKRNSENYHAIISQQES
ncbi:cyclic nucleotide-binding-like protein [Cokeromyces recurvatus]|uniref:cyclic nucleotide-binding-like protein n=1 Tax=Cokeromyces recurvatus TaxID=90255 RepID=UPI0022212705|nr:cyclic nucleotide-binding-like protein [Cokeromyces recurvatus]XP_051380179.1 cyclic nucleotide-binding-like protein [Cokeromyces recurvatus]KAI7899092.1 cyclic nucleotide-binding-like protein [Cokeromyces recurvatus]KAI7900194.1 cyclic nucleotide-binding-like protein [Cokeromyces recurvatus]